MVEDGFEEGEYFTTITWGQDDGTSGQVTKTYKFDTQDKLDAFLWGVDASSGWMEYEVKEASGEE
jgi:hypothetical protein